MTLKPGFYRTAAVFSVISAITTLGLIIRDSIGGVVQTDTLRLQPPFNANVQANVGRPQVVEGVTDEELATVLQEMGANG